MTARNFSCIVSNAALASSISGYFLRAGPGRPRGGEQSATPNSITHDSWLWRGMPFPQKRVSRSVFSAGLAAVICCIDPQFGTAAGLDNSGTETNGNSVSGQSGHLLSLVEVAPELYFTAKRRSKFYGDPNTAGGNILERSFLFGDAGGVRG